MFEVCGQLSFAYLAARRKEDERFRSEETDGRRFNSVYFKKKFQPTIWE
jgi:hypothetical protein